MRNVHSSLWVSVKVMSFINGLDLVGYGGVTGPRSEGDIGKPEVPLTLDTHALKTSAWLSLYIRSAYQQVRIPVPKVRNKSKRQT